MNPQPFARLARDARLVIEAQRAFCARHGYEKPQDIPATKRTVMGNLWLVSLEKRRLDAALARIDDLPCADYGLISYRYRGELGPIMIGAAHAEGALREAARSICTEPDPARLDVWNGEKYIPAETGA